MRKGSREALYLFLLLVLTLIDFWEPLFLGKVVYEGDTPLVGYPAGWYLAWALHQGFFPFWNPFYYLGYPFLAESQGGVFYPLNLLFALFPLSSFTYFYHLLLAFHYFLTGVFSYFWLRRRFASSELALWGAMSIEFSGFMISHLFHPNLIHVVAYFPLTLYLYDLYAESRKRCWLYWLTFILTLQIYAGHFIALTICGTGLLAYSVVFSLWELFQTNDWKRSLQPVGALLVCFIFAILLGAPQLAPSLEYAFQSARSLVPPVNEGFLYPSHFRLLLFPKAFGSLFYEKGGYIGWIPLFCLVFGAVGIKSISEKMRTPILLFISLSLFSLWLTLGPYSTLYMYVAKIPPYSLLRYPSRYLWLFDVFAIGGAGYVLSSLLSRYPPRWRGAVFWVVLVVQGWDLARMGYGYTQTTEKGYYENIPARVQFLRENLPVGGRVLSAGFRFFEQPASRYQPFIRTEEGSPSPTEIVSFLLANRYQLPTMAFFVQTTLLNRRYVVFSNELQIHTRQEILNLLGIDWVTLPKERDFPFINEAVKHYEKGYEDEYVEIYRNLDPHPRAFVVGKVVVEKPVKSVIKWSPAVDVTLKKVQFKDRNILKKLFSFGFDPAREVLLEESPPEFQEKEEITSRVEWERDTPQEIELKVRTSAEGFLVLSDVYDPGWKAWVDGEPTKIYKADYLFRAVRVPAGEHTVTFRYFPRFLIPGILLALLALLTGVFLLFKK